MKLLSVKKNGENRLAVRLDEGILDVESALAEHPELGIPTDPMAFIGSGSSAVTALNDYVVRLRDGSDIASFLIPDDNVQWGPCVPRPNKIICVGLNYRKHADESKLPYPEVPLLFNKFNNALAAEGEQIRVPKTTKELDYEVELCIVMGNRAADVSEDAALDHVFGYCVSNDVSARDLQMRTSQWMLGKTSDGFCPIGPYLVTSDEVGDPQNLDLRSFVNGELRQKSNTKDMIFTCAEIVSYISRHMTLEPGDLILTGTPEGVALGMPAESRAYLKPGNEVRVEVERLGALTNRFV